MAEITTTTWTPNEIRAFPYDYLYLAIPGTLASGQNLAKGTAVGIITLSGLVSAYDKDNTDGTEVCVGVLVEAVDASSANKPCSIYVKGTFVTSLLTGVDATAITALLARAIPGGILMF